MANVQSINSHGSGVLSDGDTLHLLDGEDDTRMDAIEPIATITIRDTQHDKTEDQPMSLQLGDTAPDFTAETTDGTIHFHQWLGDSWGVLFSHPADFTPVCTTELGTVARMKSDFDQRNVKVLAVSVDAVGSHHEWIKDINETQNVTMNFPIIADENRTVADLYGMIHPNEINNMTVRSVFVIGPDKAIKLMLTYPASTGRDFGEILRVLDSLQLTANHQVATPANWRDGDECIIVPAVTNDEISAKFPAGHREVKPYLRYTPQPNR